MNVDSALELLVQASRVSPVLRSAVQVVDDELCRLRRAAECDGPLSWLEDAIAEGFDVETSTRDNELAMLDILVRVKLGRRWTLDGHMALKGEYLEVLGAVEAIRRVGP